jgi:hypothetical protein
MKKYTNFNNEDMQKAFDLYAKEIVYDIFRTGVSHGIEVGLKAAIDILSEMPEGENLSEYLEKKVEEKINENN